MDEGRKFRSIEKSSSPETNKPPKQQDPAAERPELATATNRYSLRADYQRATETAQVVISYSHIDEVWVNDLKTMIAPVKSIDVWYDKQIEPGEDWRKEIREKLDAAQIAILFVSKDFLNSKFIKENEFFPLIKAAKERGVKIFWILIGECLYEEEDEIEHKQAAHDISRPLENLPKSELNGVLKQICMKIKSAAEDVLSQTGKADRKLVAQSADVKP